jgi:phospholipid-binding lipoprotein MlaA
LRIRSTVGSTLLVFAIGSLVLGGCGTLSSSLVDETSRLAPPGEASTESPVVAADEHAPSPPPVVITYEPITGANAPAWTIALSSQSGSTPDNAASDDADLEEYDPWEKFNEKTFAFNYNMDKYVLKPAAKGYNAIMPDMFQTMIDNAFTNLRMPIRFVNKMLQWRLLDATKEMGRFLINSTLGIGGLFDVARQEMKLEPQDADFGQTLGIWGIGPGPYLVLPLFPPLTVRDSVGYAFDGSLNILNYYIPFFPEQFGMSALDRVNERSRNLDLFQGIEEATVDLYSSVRNAYLQRRQRLIQQGH